MRVLIIGAGYIGLPLGAELARHGHDVTGLRRKPAAAEELKTAGLKPLFADITQAEELKTLPHDFDWVVFCAASGGGGLEEYRKVYVEGMRNVTQWLAPDKQPTDVPKIVYTSSTSVYGQTDGSIVNEKSRTEPAAETARALLEAENILLAAGRERNFSAIILRVAGIYGPDRGYWLKQFLRGEARLDGGGARLLNMIHRDDVVGCLMAALERGRAGEIYNAVDDQPVSQFDLFSWLSAASGKPMPPSAPENFEAGRKRGVTNKRVSNAKLKSELGYGFRYPTFREGYKQMEQLAEPARGSGKLSS
jgi:nucleoside-diphosphate-sugar epimerase